MTIVAADDTDLDLFIQAARELADGQGLLLWGDLLSEKAKRALVDTGAAFPYIGGRTGKRFAYLIGAHSADGLSALPPPSIQNQAVRAMYGQRDKMICHLCDGLINPVGGYIADRDRRFDLSVDHLVPRSRGGSDYPSNLFAAHITCNNSRRDRWTLAEARERLQARAQRP